ncbi:uncharacterized protein LOC133892171 [Phragmites australis]|uniref:uncharacterized protein LOC133892171 n=1 Tax=Phragmites australis TaxID=29695 RepID=UPI002D79ABA3|nr:uncharacterized protein LOC133892171 [Phragmites australis]
MDASGLELVDEAHGGPWQWDGEGWRRQEVEVHAESGRRIHSSGCWVAKGSLPLPCIAQLPPSPMMPTDEPPQPIHSTKEAMDSLDVILDEVLPGSVAAADDPTTALLHDADVAHAITRHLQGTRSGVGNDCLCRWLYDAFWSSVSELQLAVLRFVPMLASVYMCRAVSQKPLAGFEAMLLALYTHTATQHDAGEAETVALLNLANPSPYHDAKVSPKAKPAEVDVAVLSLLLKSHGIMRTSFHVNLDCAVAFFIISCHLVWSNVALFALLREICAGHHHGEMELPHIWSCMSPFVRGCAASWAFMERQSPAMRRATLDSFGVGRTEAHLS